MPVPSSESTKSVTASDRKGAHAQKEATADWSPKHKRAASAGRSQQNESSHGSVGTLVSSVLSLLSVVVFLIYAFIFGPDTLPEYKQRILGIAGAIAAGFLGFFLTGSIGLVISRAESRLGTFTVKATGGFALFALVLIWWLSPLAAIKPEREALTLYRVRTTVIDPQGSPVENAEVRSSLGGEAKKVAGGWEFDIPSATKPSDGMLTIYAYQPSVFLQGQTDLKLDKDPNVAVTVRLLKDKSASVHGRVVVAHTTNPLPDVWVNVVGYEARRVKTGALGEFELPAHAGDGEPIRLHAEKVGYVPEDQVHYAGSQPALIELRKK